MPLVDRRIIGLGLRAEDLLHYLWAEIRIADLVDDPVEGRRADHLAHGEGDVEGLEIFLQRDQLGAAGYLMDAVHDGAFFASSALAAATLAAIM